VKTDPDAARRLRIEELRARIEQLESQGDEAFGRFGAWDWAACLLLGLVAPIAALLWFSG
jgi:hypothetical protein